MITVKTICVISGLFLLKQYCKYVMHFGNICILRGKQTETNNKRANMFRRMNRW